MLVFAPAPPGGPLRTTFSPHRLEVTNIEEELRIGLHPRPDFRRATTSSPSRGEIAWKIIWFFDPSPKNSLAIRFERMVVYSKSGRMAEFLITNHFDKDIFEMDATVKYLDHTGQQVGTCPFSFSYQGNTGWCKAGDTIIDKAGYNFPDKATNARVVVHRLKFRDGSEWKP